MTPSVDVGALLAGGEGRRMGGRDKAVLILDGKTLADRALKRLQKTASRVVIAAPRRPVWIGEQSDRAFVSDQVDLEGEPVGPAGGLLAALLWAHDQAGRNALVFTSPVDAPFIPDDLCQRLLKGMGSQEAVIARHNNNLQPIFGVWRARLAMPLYDLVMDHGLRALRDIASGVKAAVIDIDAPDEAFLNINTPSDLERAEHFASSS